MLKKRLTMGSIKKRSSYIQILNLIILFLFCNAVINAEVLMLDSFESLKEFSKWNLTNDTINFGISWDYASNGLFSAKFSASDIHFQSADMGPGIYRNLNEEERFKLKEGNSNVLAFDYRYLGEKDPGLTIKVEDEYGNNKIQEVSISALNNGTVKMPLDEVYIDAIKTLHIYFTNPCTFEFFIDAIRLEYDSKFVMSIFLSEKEFSRFSQGGEMKLFTFETISDISKWQQTSVKVKTALSSEFVTDGKHSLCLSMDHYTSGDYEYPGIRISKSAGFHNNWSDYDSLKFDFYNPLAFSSTISIRIDDANGKWFQESVTLHPGKGTQKIRLKQINTKDISGIRIFGYKPSTDMIVYLDNLRLTPKKEGAPLYSRGAVSNRIYYDPETGFLIGNYLGASSPYTDGQLTPILFTIHTSSYREFGSNLNIQDARI